MLRLLLLTFSFSGALAYAGGFDNSGRPFDIIFGDDNELLFNFKYVQPLIDLSVRRELGQGRAMPRVSVDEIVADYEDVLVGVRWHMSDDVDCAIQWEQPFRFQTAYPDDSLSYQEDAGDASSQVPAPIDSEYSSQSFTMACRIGIKFTHEADSFSSSRLSFIVGPKYQFIDGRFSSDLTDYDLGDQDNYSAQLNGSKEWAYLLGLAYEIPELAFRLSIFFHNQVEHSLKGYVQAPAPDLSGVLSSSLRAKTITPKALNLRLQSGIAENWLAFVNLRWGDWSSVDEIVVQAGALSQQLSLFANDTLNYEIGLATRINDRLNLGGQFASLIELNEPGLPDKLSGTNLRNPQADRYSMSFGGNYLVSERIKVGLSASYYYLQHGRFSDNAYTVKLETSHAFVFSGTLQYSF